MLSSPCASRARVAALATLIAVALALPAEAQKSYKSAPIDSKLSSRGAIARNYAKGRGGDAAEFKAYVEKYLLPSMTQPSAGGLANLGKAHENLFKNFLYGATSDTQKYVHEQTLKFAIAVLKDRGYHPAVRNNALLILGKLDDRYADGATLPVPSAKANDLLCLLASRAAKSERAPRYELVTSLVGLERHTRFFGEMPAKQKKNTARTLYTILATEELPGDYAPGVRDWVYLSAADAVANLGTVGPKGAFALAIGKRVADGSLSLESRAKLAATLERVKLEAGQLDVAPLASAVNDLALAVAVREAKSAREFEKIDLGGRRAVAAGGRDKSARRMRPNTDGTTGGMVLVRNGLIEVLSDLRKGVNAVKAAMPEGERVDMTAISEAIGEALRSAGNKDEIDLNVTDAIKRMASRVKDAAAKPAAADEPTDPAEEDAALAATE